jgi:AcrR family transcriptional regulator
MKSAMQKKVDRRVERTEQLLRSALLELIEEKGFESLTVQDIIDRANVGRATFYTHFDNKEDLLISGLDELQQELRQKQQEMYGEGSNIQERLFAFGYEVFAHTERHRQLFRALSADKTGFAIQRTWHKILLDLVREDVKAVIPAQQYSAGQTEPLVRFIAGAFFGVLMWWLEGSAPLSAREIDATFHKLMMPVVMMVSRLPTE